MRESIYLFGNKGRALQRPALVLFSGLLLQLKLTGIQLVIPPELGHEIVMVAAF